MQWLTVAERERIARAAAPEAIKAHLDEARGEKRRAETQIAWWEELLVRRCREVAAGEWPPAAAKED
jgi:hypothetical protein